jgi:hypothetical protein
MRRMAVLAVFAVFCSKFSAIELAFAAETVARPRNQQAKNSQLSGCSFVVLA